MLGESLGTLRELWQTFTLSAFDPQPTLPPNILVFPLAL